MAENESKLGVTASSKGAAKKKRNVTSPRPRTEAQEASRTKLLASEMVIVMLPKTGDTKMVTIISNGVTKEYMSEGDPETVTINGYVYHVPRGVMVEVPKGVAEVLQAQKETLQYYNEELKRNFKNGNPHGSQTFEN